ncbi:MAG: hypothetical protein K2H43_03540 [Clostridia bacterium]|nr:hypothetical protein [Clostridia bacterium]
MKKNTVALVLAIIGAVFGVLGGIMWAACAEACADVSGGASIGYMVGFILLGIGGAVVSLIGGIQAFSYKKAGLPLSIVGLVCQVVNLVLECVFVEGFSFVLSMWTIFSVILLAVATVFAAKKQN